MPEPGEIGKKRVVYTIPNMEQVTVQKNITYKTVDDLELKLDIYYPPDFNAGSQRPTVIFVHGDAPPAYLKDIKDGGQYTSWGQLTAASGLIAITFNHRSSENFTKMYEVAVDIDDLIHHVRANAEAFHVDKDTLGIWVCSAGVPYGLQAAMREPPTFVRCIVAYYGFMNLQHMRQDFPPEITDETLKDFSAVYYLSNKAKEIAPIFIARVGRDYPQINESIDQFVKEALAQNITIDFMNHPEGQHAFDVRDDNARSREIIKATLEFLKSHLLGHS